MESHHSHILCSAALEVDPQNRHDMQDLIPETGDAWPTPGLPVDPATSPIASKSAGSDPSL
eukprot:5746063-Karenia_brevis.AAC.1